MEKIIFTRQIRIAVFIFLLAAIGIIYFYRLDFTPVHLNQDEMMFGLNAYSIAKFGKDFYGNPYPFYFWHLGSFWATPIITYFTSLFLKFLPLTEWSIRIPSAVVGLFSIFTLSLVVKLVFKDRFLTLLSILVAGITPALFIQSRLTLDNLYTVPFVVIWILFLKLFEERRNILYLLVAGLSLGVGIHSYHAAKIVMPLYFLISVGYLFLIKKANVGNLLLFAFGFAIPIVAFIPWLRVHPDTLLNQVNYIGSIDRSVSVTKGIWGVFNIERLTSFVSNYVTYLSPRILFVEGDRSLIHSTGKIGVFGFSVGLLILLGVAETIRRKRDWFSKLILIGFLTYPAAPSIVNDPQRTSRGLVVIPFGILLAIYGISFLREQKERIFKTVLYVLVFFAVLEFCIFLSDYFGDYRVRSNSWFNGSIGSAYESAIKSTERRKVNKIYLDGTIYFSENYFDFYQIKFGKNLKEKTVLFEPSRQNFSKFGHGSIVVIQASSIPGKPDKVGEFEKIETIREPNGYETFLVYYRD